MNQLTNSNIIVGSKLALAISSVVGSPIRLPLAAELNGRRAEFEKMNKRCESLKNKGLKLLHEMEIENSRIASNAACMRSSADRLATKRISKVMTKIKEQQTSFHFKMETLLDAMMMQIRSTKHSKI